MNRARRWTGFVLEEDRHWRAFLLLLFVLAACGRFLVYVDLSGHPAGRLQEWFGSDPWFYQAMGQDVTLKNDWLLKGRNFLLTREMVALAPERSWDRWANNQLPRGALAVYLVAVSVGLSGGLAVYKIAAVLAGSALAVIGAQWGALLFADRRAGAIAGIVLAMMQPMVLGTLIPGPWLWEALAFGALGLCFCRVRADSGNPAEWLLLGLATGVAVWLRPLFFWGVVLMPAALIAWRISQSRACLLAWLIPLAVCVGGLVARNAAADSTRYPIVGHPGWDFANATHPGVAQSASLPSDVVIMDAGRGRFWRVLRLSLGQSSWRAALPKVLNVKLRELVGARDVAWSFNADYLRRRSEMLRVACLAPDTTMAAGWGALVFLLLCGKLPRPLMVALGIVLVHGLLFRTTGMDRLPLHVAFALLIGGGLAEAWKGRVASPSRPFVYLALWAFFHFALQVDDHARGSRYRFYDFRMAAMDFRRSGDERQFREELRDYERVRAIENVLDNYWYRK